MTKRFCIIILSIFFCFVMLPGCGQTTGSDNEFTIVCTVFPSYDWVRQILGRQADKVNLTFLSNNGIDLHNYEPSMEDIIKISNCDLFIYVGGESDEWVESALAESANQKRIVITLMETLGSAVKIEEIIEGMEEEEAETEAEEHEEVEYDEHVWLSLKNAKILSSAIADKLSVLDSEYAEEYKENLADYIEKLSALDTEYQAAVNSSSVKTLLFGDRFPFRYLLDDYNLKYYAAFPGCSAETEASFKTIIFLAEKLEELKLNYIIVTENSDQSIAKSIIGNTSKKNQSILAMDSMQSVLLDNAKAGTTYLSIMENNLAVLTESLK